MKYISGKQVKIVTASNPFDFEAKLNAALSKLNEEFVSYELKLEPQAGLIAYIILDVSKKVPETLAEEHQIEGDILHCKDCPFLTIPSDKRLKKGKCYYMDKVVRFDRAACDRLYEGVTNGTLTLRPIGEEIER